jgi:hypothetical protein
MTLNLVSEQRCANLKDILVDKDNQWQPLVDKKGKAIDGQATFRIFSKTNFIFFSFVSKEIGK